MKTGNVYHKDMEGKPESANERADVRVYSLTTCIIFMRFMVKLVNGYPQ